MKNTKSFLPKLWSSIFFSVIALTAFGQLPQNIEPGQDQKSVDLYQQPEYVIPILTLFVVLIGYYFWRRNRKK